MNTHTIYADKNCGRPRLDWTDKKWHQYFHALKRTVSPIQDKQIRRLPVTPVRLNTGEQYKGETAYQSYCNFINDVLATIRSGEVDYCYFIYQIADLLLFEPELRTKLCCEDRLCPYFEVWLDTQDTCIVKKGEK